MTSTLSLRTAEADAVVSRAFAQTSPPVAVVAVGGYGRGELFPFSDIDLLLLTEGPLTTDQRERVSEFLRLLWDSNLRVSQSVHTAAECCEIHDGNLEMTISLLDQRFLAGDRDRYDQLTRRFPKFLTAQKSFIAAHLAAMTRGRHSKHGNTIYHLEPNVKEHPGGLRDLHVLGWLGQLQGLRCEPLDDARCFLFDVRTKLHQHFQRDNNQLTFEAQDLLSSHPAQWMREYYRHARQIDRALEQALEACEPGDRSLFGQFRDWRSRLSNSDFTVSREHVLLRNPSQLEAEPAVVMRLMTFIARHQIALARDTEARLANVQDFNCNWAQFRELLTLAHCGQALRAMAGLGLLQKIIPEWSRIDCLVVRDFYHRYTVDEHTLVALQTIETLATCKDTPHDRFARLLSEIDQPELLRFALLLHDIGKGENGGGHSRRSTEISQAVMDRLNVPEPDRSTVLFLIEHHLDLGSIMTSRDFTEAATARQIAERSGTIEMLKLLTLLTYADISAVTPGAMTPWRLDQLWQVYLIGHEQFTRELETERIRLHNQNPSQASPEAAAFLEGLPTRYLKTHTPSQIAGHIELARQGSAVDLVRVNGTYRATVVATDRPYLLASISGALSSFGMNILKAEAFANQRGQALDTFIFDDPHRTLELNPGENDRLHSVVERAVAGKLEVEKLMQRRRKTAARARIEPSVAFTNDASEASTLVEIVAEDRPGLLYDLTYAISSEGANIEVVLIDTEAHRALDVFYITVNGRKLTTEKMSQLKARLFHACTA